jgi:hypothetical protein
MRACDAELSIDPTALNSVPSPGISLAPSNSKKTSTLVESRLEKTVDGMLRL